MSAALAVTARPHLRLVSHNGKLLEASHPNVAIWEGGWKSIGYHELKCLMIAMGQGEISNVEARCYLAYLIKKQWETKEAMPKVVSRLTGIRLSRVVEPLRRAKRVMSKLVWEAKKGDEQKASYTLKMPKKILKELLQRSTKGELIIFLHLCQQVSVKRGAYVFVKTVQVERKTGLCFQSASEATLRLKNRGLIFPRWVDLESLKHNGKCFRFKGTLLGNTELKETHDDYGRKRDLP